MAMASGAVPTGMGAPAVLVAMVMGVTVPLVVLLSTT
jgi:hypothetical protein